MKIGIYGGSFNPIHNGHINIAKLVQKSLNLDLLIIVPVGNHSSKNTKMLSGELRVQLCKKVFENENKIIVSDIEVQKNRVSYSIETLKELRKLYGQKNEYYEIIGEDLVKEFESWKNYEEILELSKIVICKRKGYKNILNNKKIISLNTPFYEESSTIIREKIIKKESISGLVPKEIEEIVKKEISKIL